MKKNIFSVLLFCLFLVRKSMFIMKNIPDSLFGYIDFPLNYCGFINKIRFCIVVIITYLFLAHLSKNGAQDSWRIIQKFSFQNH